MIRRIAILGSILAVSLLPAAIAYAFEGQRHGFVLGFSAGPGYLDFNQGSESTVGVETDLKLGSGLTDQTIEAGVAATWHDPVTLYNVYLTFGVIGY